MPSHNQRLLYSQGLKECGICSNVLPFAAYNQRKESGKQYCVAYCKDCERMKYQNNRDSIREIRRRQSLGVPIGTYNFLVAEYGEECSICKSKEPGGRSKESGQFHIDHDHETEIVRGLLCTTCNVGIGMLKHSPQILLAAIGYLAKRGHSIEELEKFLGPVKLKDSIDASLDELGL